MRPREEEEVRIRPTIIATAPTDGGGDVVGFVTADLPAAGGEALVVFRGLEDAREYQERTGKSTPGEGYKIIVGLSAGALADVLDTLGAPLVAMPGLWTGGDGEVDVFDAGDFVAMLEESRRG